MKQAILMCLLLGALFFGATDASARKGIIVYGNGEKAELFKELPAEAVINDMHVNVGVLYSQFSLFWIPMWNYGETKYVLLDDAEDSYWNLDAETIESLKTDFNIELPQEPSIGFWNKIGGKLIWGTLILLVIIGLCIKDKDKEETQPQPPSSNSSML